MTDSEGNEIGKLFVGGISQNTNNVSLRIYFSQFGELEDAVVMMDNKTGRSRGFGYVKFRDPECVKIVLATKPHWLDGKEIDAKQCNINMKGRNRRSLKVFVGGIGLDQDVASITAFFEKFGRVTDVNLMMDPNKQRHRGFAFIGFEDEFVVNRLINMHYITMGNKQVEIKAMEPPNFGRKMTTSMTRQGNDLNDLRDTLTRDNVNSKLSGKHPPRNRLHQSISGSQCNTGLDTPSYGLTSNQQPTAFLENFIGDQMPPNRLIGDQYASTIFPIPSKFNPMPVIFTNGFVPIAPTVYPGCQMYSYPILQPQFLHPGVLSGSEEVWPPQGLCPQQQILLQPIQSNKINSGSQTSPPISKSFTKFNEATECDQRSKSGNMNTLDHDVGMWNVNSKTRCGSGSCTDGVVLHNQEMPNSRILTGSTIPDSENQKATILAKPSGDNFDRDEAGTVELTTTKEEYADNSAEQNRETINPPVLPNLNSSWLFPMPQQLSSTWNLRPQFWSDMQLPPNGFGLPQSYMFQPTSTLPYDPSSTEHPIGGLGFGYPVMSERSSFRDDEGGVNEHPSIPTSPPNSSQSGNTRQHQRESPESLNRDEIQQNATIRHHDNTGRWNMEKKSSKTSEFNEKNGGGGAGSVATNGGGLCSTEKTSVAAGDHHSNNFRNFRV